MANPRTSQGHVLVVVLVGLTAVVHGALLGLPGARPTWFLVVTSLVALAAVVLAGAGLAAGRVRFGGDAEDGWLVACAAVGALGVMSGFGLALTSVAGGGVLPWGIGALLVDALTVRIAVFTLRRVPSGQRGGQRG
ncbi:MULTISPECIES: hypothetical protein [unclassified Pseudonocardia]|jgi:hypothetical protein|uniref:hypothetical protein n=1 Tax=unclassified Pseudonocardia TaxID=2619320 RepID=UPI00095EC8AD|nr:MULTISPECIES: hypothetical protein [unclassified Pseudonocardia]MBN9103308.1 hypothetical protein [Pseudonocardia sp.]OJY38406.1 MAG: hypothetical protein BGP03_05420 [Pseudonocardia sp. 73-21]